MSGEPIIQHFTHRPSSTSDTSISEAWYNYTCGHCEVNVNGKVVARISTPDFDIKWLLCTNCADGSVIPKNKSLLPSTRFGPIIQGLPDDIAAAYNEARSCYSIHAYTSCENMCRKILMHVAVEKGAKVGDSFSNYIFHLEKEGFVTPPMSKWVKLIRKHGNKANHELNTPDKKQAESTLMFTAELLRLIYEMETISNRYTSEDTQ